MTDPRHDPDGRWDPTPLAQIAARLDARAATTPVQRSDAQVAAGDAAADQAAVAGMLLALCDGRHDDVELLVEATGARRALDLCLLLGVALVEEVSDGQGLDPREVLAQLARRVADG